MKLSHRPRREHRFPVSALVRGRNPLPSNARCLQSYYLATGLHAIIHKNSFRTSHITSPLQRSAVFYFSFVGWDWIHSVRRPLICLLYQPQMIGEYGAFGGIRIGRGNQSTRRKPATVPHCPPQIQHDLAWDRTRAAAVGSRLLTARSMTQPSDQPVNSV
jgi:hypothetical protein